MTHNYGKYYDLKPYLFTDVTQKFVKKGRIDPTDFYMILIWKAERVKNKQRDRLAKKSGSFQNAVKKISKSLRAASGSEKRLQILMKGWNFRHATATAILTVLYPKEFTVYDVRVCGQLKAFGNFERLAWRKSSDGLWRDYEKFLDAVKRAVPQEHRLRDKDRYLWGKSVYDDVKKACG
jgi:hypothetical protein